MTGINNRKNSMTLAGNDISHDQSTVKTYEITKIDKNVKFMQKCSECLVSKLFLIPVIQNINVRTHLTLVGTCWPQELPVKHMVALINDKNTWEK